MAPASNMPPGFRPSPTKAGQLPSSGGEKYVLQAPSTGFAPSPPRSQGQRGSGGMPPGFIPSPPQSQTKVISPQVISPQGQQQNVQAWSLHPLLKPSEPPSYVAGGTLNSAANQVAYGTSGSILGPNDGWQPVGGGAPYAMSPPPQAVVSPSSYGGPVGGGAPRVMSPPPQPVVSPSSYGGYSGYNGYSGPVQAAPPPIKQQSPIGVPPQQLYSVLAASPPPIQPPGQNGGPPRAPTLMLRNSGPQQSLPSMVRVPTRLPMNKYLGGNCRRTWMMLVALYGQPRCVPAVRWLAMGWWEARFLLKVSGRKSRKVGWKWKITKGGWCILHRNLDGSTSSRLHRQ
jgi:hypothetical protein